MSKAASIGRYAEVPVDRMAPDEQAAHQALLDGPRGRVSGHFRIWLANPRLVHAVAGIDEHVNSEAFALSAREREICILVAAETYRAEYVWTAHERESENAGLPAAVVEAIASRREPGFTDDRERTVYEVAVALLRGAGDLPRSLYERAVEILGDTGLTDLVALVGYYASVCFTMNAYAVPASGGPAVD